MTRTTSNFAKMLLPLGAALALAACGPNEEPAYEAGVTDEGGGDLIVTEETPAVDVEVPDTEMTPVPPEGTPTAQGSPSAKITPIEGAKAE